MRQTAIGLHNVLVKVFNCVDGGHALVQSLAAERDLLLGPGPGA